VSNPDSNARKVKEIQRAKDIAEMMDSRGWKEWLAPSLKKDIEDNLNIKHINETNIEKTFYQQKIRVDVYSGIFKKLDEWKNRGETFEKELANGKK